MNEFQEKEARLLLMAAGVFAYDNIRRRISALIANLDEGDCGAPDKECPGCLCYEYCPGSPVVRRHLNPVKGESNE